MSLSKLLLLFIVGVVFIIFSQIVLFVFLMFIIGKILAIKYPLSCTSAELPTPTKDHSGVTKTIFTHISNLHGLLNDWDKLQLKGKKICRSISSIKLHEFQDDYYPHEVKVLVETLLEVVEGLHDVCGGIELLDKQINALSKLQPLDTPLMQTWTASQISENVSNLHDSFKQEFNLKKTILENIAHCRDEHLMETYTSAWEYNMYFDMDKFTYLFMEFGITI